MIERAFAEEGEARWMVRQIAREYKGEDEFWFLEKIKKVKKIDKNFAEMCKPK